ncbi:hypothetical protein SO802_024880 [Lithocarpus litseifolius]|uniref:No apical meristem-associated C-terminal domain-containing protein n=1 Tax=Lithocarpus litseifolius TaxID=425828 RepID=A0AAW2CD07_9ROSI
MDSGIPRGTSFTNLIEDSYNDYMSGSSHISDEDSVLQAQTFSQMSPPQVESRTKKSQHGINISIEEDILLVSAFLNVHQDVVKSNNQKRQTYWMRIWEYYHKWKTFTSESTAGSLMNRWSAIQLSTNKFCGFLSQIKSKNESGKTEEDKLDAARNLYHTIQGTKFQYEHFWNLLKRSPKWRFEASSPANLEFEHLEDDDTLQVPIVNLERPNLERPPGVRAEKERLKKQKCKEGTTSHIEDVLNVMMEEKRKTDEMKMACIEKGRLADHE